MEPPYVGCYDIGMLRYFFLGFLGGILLSLFYILFGSWSWFTPQAAWARAVFAPGLYTGGWAHETLFRHFRGANVDVLASEAVGIITMGLIFGGLACLMKLGMGGERGESKPR